MLKEQAVASLGQQSLLLPAWVKAALAANDRLKLYLTLLQAAVHRAEHPAEPLADWHRDLQRAGIRDPQWLLAMVDRAYLDDQVLVIPQPEQLLDALAADLATMARPLCDGEHGEAKSLRERRDAWLQKLQALKAEEGIDRDTLGVLTHGQRAQGDSLHLLVMDLHKALNALSSAIATEIVDGAHVWQVTTPDYPLIRAFMRGLNRTAPLKLSHPGLDTAVTRDGEQLLIQNDIGTNDAHVIVISIEHRHIALTYSDLHSTRFEFFCRMLEAIGFEWTLSEPVTSELLNAGKPYRVGRAAMQAGDERRLLESLEAVASRIVFVIDWNRARKQLQRFVRKSVAIDILQQAAANDWGHMAWLQAGGEQLVFAVMESVDSEAFQIGDRLDDVMGESAASAFLLDLLHIASAALLRQGSSSLVADEARLLLARALRKRTIEFDLLAEHAAYCHALALTLVDALEADATLTAASMAECVARAKTLERQADHLLMNARQRAERRERWQSVVGLLGHSDDVADALEEAIFIYSLVVDEPLQGFPASVGALLQQLAEMTLAAIQDQVRVVEISRQISERGDPADSEEFLQTLWRMLRAERLCDELARDARRAIVRALHTSPVGLQLANDLVATIEQASDALLALGYALRRRVLMQTGVSA